MVASPLFKVSVTVTDDSVTKSDDADTYRGADLL
jgi:hypothetical protein